MCWSGGKDSSLALHELQSSGRYEIVSLLTTVAEGYDRVSHHGVRRSLLRQQAGALDLPLHEVVVSMNCTNEEYEAKMEEALERYGNQRIETVAFGDIFLEDLREYRERNLAKVGMRGLFPIWKRDTNELMREFLGSGFQTIVVCVDGQVLDRSFAGRIIDDEFLSDLPTGVDPCGENGEFHTFTFDGPPFRERIGFQVGEIVERDTRFFCDLLPS